LITDRAASIDRERAQGHMHPAQCSITDISRSRPARAIAFSIFPTPISAVRYLRTLDEARALRHRWCRACA
jgi:hypothetical protein